MFDALHNFFAQVLFGPDSDLGWAAVRAVTALCSLFAARAVRHSPDRFLAWATVILGAWVGLKVADDLTHRGAGPNLTLYFMISNLMWSAILIGLARMANRERHYLLEKP